MGKQRLCSVRVAVDEDLEQASGAAPFELLKAFSGQVGLEFSLGENEPFTEVRRKVASLLGVRAPADQHRFWTWKQRQDGTYRPEATVQVDVPISAFVRPDSDPPVVDLFLERAALRVPLPPYNPTSDLLLFLKVYTGAAGGAEPRLQYRGHVVASSSATLESLLSAMQRAAGLPGKGEVGVFQEALPSSMPPAAKQLDPTAVLSAANLQSGDVLVLSQPDAAPSLQQFIAGTAEQQQGQQGRGALPPAQRVAQLLQQAALEAERALQGAARETAQVRQAAEAREAQLQQRTQEAEQAAQRAEQEAEHLRGQLQAKEAEVQAATHASEAGLQKAVEAADAMLAELQRRLEEAERAQQRAAEEAAQLRQELQAQQQQHEESMRALEAWQLSSAEETALALQRAQEEAAELRQRLEEQDAAGAELRHAVQAGEAALQAAAEEAAALRQQAEKQAAELDQMQADALQAELASKFAAEEAGLLERQLAARGAEAAQLRQELQAREAAHAERVAALEAEVAAARQETDHALQRAAEETARLLDQEVQAAAAQHSSSLAAMQAQMQGAAAAAEEAAALRHALERKERELQAVASARDLMMKRVLVMEGDEESCRALSAGGLRSLLRSLEASSARVRELLRQ